ncbi:MAG: barstar family protein [Candidatus Schmidhempelia sp.]|nr:barstar family protein [Candidatus Schmidhempelia sp.]
MVANHLAFKFINGNTNYNTGEIFFARVDPTIANTEELVKSLYYLLWFPGYFGFNWNALEDCLNDFNWISEEKIVIVHDVIPQLPDDDLKIYLDILNTAIYDWQEDGQHQLEVVFQEKDKALISKLLFS